MLAVILAIIIISGFFSYIGWNIIRGIRKNSKWKKPILFTLLILGILTPVSQILPRIFNIHNSATYTLHWVVFIAFGFFSLFFVFSLIKDIGLITTESVIAVISIVKKTKKSSSPQTVSDPSRRKFMLNSLNLGIIGISGSMTAVGLYESRWNLQVKKVPLKFDRLSKALNGIKIAQISDLHLGLTIDKNFVNEVVEKVNSLKADIVVITGDLVDGGVAQLGNDAEPLGRINTPLGKYFVTGNHEYYSGVEQWLSKIQSLGFKTLLNENVIIKKDSGKFLLAGVTDYNGGRFSHKHNSDPFKAVINPEVKDEPKILLAHQPRSVFAASTAGFDLVLSGHTHGGQYFPWNLFVKLQQPYVSGLHKYKNTLVYVNKGTGYWGPPLRVGATPEITLIEMVAG